MYLTDVLDAAIMDKTDITGDDVPVEYLQEQQARMGPILERVMQLEQVHRDTFPDIPFSWSLLRYIDYMIFLNTTGTKQ
jgi:hypothetical protein